MQSRHQTAGENFAQLESCLIFLTSFRVLFDADAVGTNRIGFPVALTTAVNFFVQSIWRRRK